MKDLDPGALDRWITTDPRDNAPECPTCEGGGTIEPEVADADWDPCPTCGGTGALERQWGPDPDEEPDEVDEEPDYDYGP